MPAHRLLRAILVCLAAVLASAAGAAEYAWFGGQYANWPTEWIALNGLNDPRDGINYPELDFVGNTTYPGAYYQWDNNYFYFRMRMDVASVTQSTYGDTLFILIDLPGYGNNGAPDYGFAWDSKETGHGVELTVWDTVGTTWNQTRMKDVDDNVAKKVSPPDFGEDGDAYLRTIDGIPTSDFGDTTFVDWAISFNHLENYTALGRNQTWYIQLGSIANANDHNFIDTDIAGGYAPSSNVIGSMGTSLTTPEPASMALTLLALGIAGGAVRRRKAKAEDDSEPFV